MPGRACSRLAIYRRAFVVIAFAMIAGCRREALALEPAPSSTPQVGIYYFDGWAHPSPSDIHVGTMPQNYPERKPLSGWYDNSAALVHQQIEWAQGAGATFFIFDWYDTSRDKNPSDQTLNSAVTFFKHDPNKLGMQYALLYVNNGSFSIPRAKWTAACHQWVNNFLKDPAYFKIGGKPLLVVFGVGAMEREWGGPQGVAMAWKKLRDTAMQAGLPGVFVVGSTLPGPQNGWPNLKAMVPEGYDAYSGYNYPGEPGTVPGNNPYSLLARGSLAIFNDFASDGSTPFIPVVTDGWDPRPWNETPFWYTRSPAEFSSFVTSTLGWWCDHPAMRVTASPLIFIEAWNELGEGSYLVPTSGDGFAYTKALKQGLSAAGACKQQ